MATIKTHFTKCNNIRCKTYFLIKPQIPIDERGFLCESCEEKSHKSHTVQCSTCQAVINFVYALPHEEKLIFNVEKCSICGGSIEDEWKIEPIYSPESYI